MSNGYSSGRAGSSTSGTPAFTSPRRSPTDSSYYDFNGNPSSSQNGTTWMYARDARAQQANAPVQQQQGARYASYFGYHSSVPQSQRLPLTTAAEQIPIPNTNRTSSGWLHHPLVPGQQHTYRGNRVPGAVRSVYPPSDPTNFDVIYHDRAKQGNFSMATYHPKK